MTGTSPSADADAPAALAVVVGSFAPLHDGHLALLAAALAAAPRLVVGIGAAFLARSPRHPFHWTERQQMLRQALPDAAGRIEVLPLREATDDTRWAAALRQAVGARLAAAGFAPEAPVVLVGTEASLPAFDLPPLDGWRRLAVPWRPQADAGAIRDAYFAAADAGPAVQEAALARIGRAAPPATVEFLRAFAAHPEQARLAEEWRQIKRYHDAWSVAPYPPVLVTVDALVCCAGHVLLIRRGQPPGRGLLALPGGFLEPGDTLRQSALRELAEETGLALPAAALHAALREVAVFDRPDRGQRGRTVTHVHRFDLGDGPLPPVAGGDDALEARWFPIAALAACEEQFHDDHFQILDRFLGLLADGPD